MSKIFPKAVSVIVATGFLAPVFVFAQTPNLPHQFFGTVNFTDGVAPNGMTVEAKINGVVVGSSVTSGGNYGYNPNLLFATDNQGNNAGKTIEFFVAGIKANQVAVFENGRSTQLNLTVPEPIPTTPTPTSTPAPGGGGASTPSTPTSPLSAAAQKVDANGDGKIDVLDFNALMVAWGSEGANLTTDFNGDGKVDILDFNLIMVHWTG